MEGQKTPRRLSWETAFTMMREANSLASAQAGAFRQHGTPARKHHVAHSRGMVGERLRRARDLG